jgi:hypothetical protein
MQFRQPGEPEWKEQRTPQPFQQQLQPPERPYTQSERYALVKQPPRSSAQQRKLEQQNKQDWSFLGVILAILAGIALLGGVSHFMSSGTSSSSTTQSTSYQATAIDQSTPVPTMPTSWTVAQTFTGNGTQKTALFTVPGTWKLVWSCIPSTFDGSYNVQVDVDTPGGSSLDAGAVNTICQAGNISGSTYEYQGGQVYLDVNSEAYWKITIQVPNS